MSKTLGNVRKHKHKVEGNTNSSSVSTQSVVAMIEVRLYCNSSLNQWTLTVMWQQLTAHLLMFTHRTGLWSLHTKVYQIVQEDTENNWMFPKALKCVCFFKDRLLLHFLHVSHGMSGSSKVYVPAVSPAKATYFVFSSLLQSIEFDFGW